MTPERRKEISTHANAIRSWLASSGEHKNDMQLAEELLIDCEAELTRLEQALENILYACETSDEDVRGIENCARGALNRAQGEHDARTL